jgi:hypothetical protein
MKTVLSIAALILGISATAGWITRPHAVEGSFTVRIHVYSGAEYGTSLGFCGWHTWCVGGANYERGIDWDSTINNYGYYNGWAFSHDSSPTVRAVAIPGNNRPPELSNCTTTSLEIRDTIGNRQVMLFYVHVSRTLSTSFDIYADEIAYGGEWAPPRILGNQIEEAGCTSFGTHVMTWYAGLAGVINILPRDYWWNCTAPGWRPDFYFPCFDTGGSFSLPHDLSDWAYVMEW